MTDITAPIDSLQVMAYIVQRCEALGIHMNTTKLQKLMYCCYGACLGRYNFRICDESPEAWQYGPVFPRTLKALQEKGVEYFKLIPTKDVEQALPQNLKDLIDSTLRTFGKFAANQLVNWSHFQGSPWAVASSNGAVLREQIPDGLIKEYFEKYVLAPRQ